jgi:predicted secreted protein
MKICILIFISLQFVYAKDFKGAEYRTTASYTYGRFEAKIKSAAREGVLCSLFTYYDGTGGVGAWNEIDIEIMGRYTDEVQFNTITPGQVNHVRHQYLKFNPALDFHSYAFEWTPEYVAWFIDGVEVYRQMGTHIQSLTRPQKLMMNIWNPTYPNWAGKWNPDVLPAFAFYDSVKYYAYTPGTGNYGSNNNFTLSWIDEMNVMDAARWEKGVHTFDGNNCDFIAANSVFQNGNMALCLTNSTNLGYTDIKGPVPLWARNEGTKIKVYFSEELDSSSASDISNYLITNNVLINSAILKDDLKSVELSVSGLVDGNIYTVVIMNVKDRFQNKMVNKSVLVINSAPLSFPVKINPGGPSALGYLHDTEFNEFSEYGYMDGWATQYSAGLQINGTTEDSIYQSEHLGMAVYKIRVPDGKYNIKLMFAENHYTNTGNRLFDVYVQGKMVLHNLDVYQRVGSNRAFEYTVDNIDVTDGRIELFFSAIIDYALIDGIVINKINTGIGGSIITPSLFMVEQNYPNPFNGATKIRFYSGQDESISISIYNILGRKVFTRDIKAIRGENEFSWYGKDNSGKALCSGVYIYSFKGHELNQTKKLIILN